MTTVARVRKGALALPEAEEGTHLGLPSFAVRGKRFASLSEGGAQVQLRLPADRVDEVVRAHGGASPIARSGRTVGVWLAISDLDVRDLDRLLREAWETIAPKRLVAEHSPSSAEALTSGLPAIGRPATRALALADITTLERVASHTRAELLDLHGVGPKAVRILGEALAEQGRSFRES